MIYIKGLAWRECLNSCGLWFPQHEACGESLEIYSDDRESQELFQSFLTPEGKANTAAPHVIGAVPEEWE